MLDKELNRQTMGERIDLLRKKQGLTKTDLARKVGVTDDAVRKWINGERIPRREHLMVLSKLFEKPVDYILFGALGPLVAEEKQPAYDRCDGYEKDEILGKILNKLIALDKSDLILLLNLLERLSLKKKTSEKQIKEEEV